jgi:hypothetical protein
MYYEASQYMANPLEVTKSIAAIMYYEASQYMANPLEVTKRKRTSAYLAHS